MNDWTQTITTIATLGGALAFVWLVLERRLARIEARFDELIHEVHAIDVRLARVEGKILGLTVPDDGH
jgi:hypothetical protein